MEHGDDCSVIFRQLHHGLVQSSLQLREVGFPYGTARGGGFHEFLVVLDAGVDVIQAQLKSAAAFFEEIQGHVHGDGMNPGVK